KSLTINNSGATVDDDGGDSLTLTGALAIMAGTFQLDGGALAAGSISIGSAGTLQIQHGGYTLSEPIANSGSVWVQNSVKITTAISGTGSFLLDNGGTLEFASTDSEQVKFITTDSATLQIDQAFDANHSLTFGGLISGASTHSNFDVTHFTFVNNQMSWSSLYSSSTNTTTVTFSNGTGGQHVTLN